jgi:hypothetical protein
MSMLDTEFVGLVKMFNLTYDKLTVAQNEIVKHFLIKKVTSLKFVQFLNVANAFLTLV